MKVMLNIIHDDGTIDQYIGEIKPIETETKVVMEEPQDEPNTPGNPGKQDESDIDDFVESIIAAKREKACAAERRERLKALRASLTWKQNNLSMLKSWVKRGDGEPSEEVIRDLKEKEAEIAAMKKEIQELEAQEVHS